MNIEARHADAISAMLPRRTAYSLAAAAATAGFGGANADAAVLYSGPQELSVGQGFFQTLKLNADEYVDLKLENFVFTGGNYQGAFVPFAPGGFVGFTQNGLNYASALSAGTLVGPLSDLRFEVSLAYGTHNPNAQFNNTNNAFLGFGFPIGIDNYYGWMRVSIDNAAGTFVIHDWAYESELGKAIIVGALPLTGDYNSNNVVDAADYIIWRDTLGSTTDLRANGDDLGASNDVIDAADYAAWRANFGAAAGSGAVVGSTAVPEPVTLGMLAVGAAGLAVLRRSRQR